MQQRARQALGIGLRLRESTPLMLILIQKAFYARTGCLILAGRWTSLGQGLLTYILSTRRWPNWRVINALTGPKMLMTKRSRR
jgi:hypothetical protein